MKETIQNGLIQAADWLLSGGRYYYAGGAIAALVVLWIIAMVVGSVRKRRAKAAAQHQQRQEAAAQRRAVQAAAAETKEFDELYDLIRKATGKRPQGPAEVTAFINMKLENEHTVRLAVIDARVELGLPSNDEADLAIQISHIAAAGGRAAKREEQLQREVDQLKTDMSEPTVQPEAQPVPPRAQNANNKAGDQRRRDSIRKAAVSAARQAAMGLNVASADAETIANAAAGAATRHADKLAQESLAAMQAEAA